MAETKKNAKSAKKTAHGKINAHPDISKEMPISFYEGQKKGKKPVKDKKGMIIPE